LRAAEGIEGPYGALYGGTDAKSITPASVGDVMASWQTNIPKSESVTTIMPTQIGAAVPTKTFSTGEYAGLPLPFVSEAGKTTKVSSDLGTVGGLKIVPGSAAILGKAGALPSDVTTPIYTQRSDIPAVALEAGVSMLDALTSLPNVVTFGAVPAWKPGSELLTKYGQTGSPQLTQFQTQLADVEAQRPTYNAILSDVQSKTAQLNTLTSGKINTQGEFTGTPEEYEKVQKLQSDIQTGKSEYNKFQTKYQDILSQGYKSGAIIKGVGDTYQVAPEAERPYGAFSDWSNSVQKLITGYTPSQFAKFESVLPYVSPALPSGTAFGEGLIKTATSPEQALQSAVQGLALYTGTAGAGEGLGMLSKSTGTLGTVSGGALKVSESPIIKYGAPAVYGGASLYSAAGGVDIGGPSFIAPKVGWGKFESNVGAQAGNLLWMGAGAVAPSALARITPSLDLKSSIGKVYEATNFPNIPSVGDIGGGLKGKVSDTLFSLRQKAAGVERVGGLSYDYDVTPKVSVPLTPEIGSATWLKEKGIASPKETGPIPTWESSALSDYLGRYYSGLVSEVKTAGFVPESSEYLPQIKAMTEIESGRISKLPPLERYDILKEVQPEGGVSKVSEGIGKITPQKGSLTYLQEKGVAFNVPSSEDILKLNLADVRTNEIFNIKTEGGVVKPIIEEEKITPQKGSLTYLQEKGVAFPAPSVEDILKLNRAEAITEGIFKLKTEGGREIVKPKEEKITPQKGSLTYLQEKGIALSMPSVEDTLKLSRAEAETESIFKLKTDIGGAGTTIKSEFGKLAPQIGSFNWLKENVAPKEGGPEFTLEKEKITDYLLKFRENLIKEAKASG
jgi:hypothetical protein